MSEIFSNKVAESGLVTLNLENYYPKGETAVFDLKDFLFMGLILKEKDFREALKNEDWEKYRDKYVAVTCTADAIVPASGSAKPLVDAPSPPSPRAPLEAPPCASHRSVPRHAETFRQLAEIGASAPSNAA